MALIPSIPQTVNLVATRNQHLTQKFVPRDPAGEILDLTDHTELTLFVAPDAADKLKYNSSNVAKLKNVAIADVQSADATGIQVGFIPAELDELSEFCFDLPMSYYAVSGDGDDTCVVGTGRLLVSNSIR